MIAGSVTNGLNSSGGFRAGSRIAVDHQRVNGTSFIFSASVAALLAVSASGGINILRNTPSILSALQENVREILSTEKERRKRRGPVTRRFIVTEGTSEKDGAMIDLPNL
ncbi:hypothetical protein H4582DRAFT_2017753, partial [Lactarius indigo]